MEQVGWSTWDGVGMNVVGMKVVGRGPVVEREHVAGSEVMG